ncbi:MAG TPA: alpha/beta fold hydrolase [Thermoleophilaceae bacterium]|jgi:pimeloyl-ACP methyl ester carboxylesterase|nr:alpha/beta fold hydrolase [Thermoleophilaceae bacterium]
MNEQRVTTNGVEIVYETIGDPSGMPLLLVMGLGMQLIHWDRELCEELVERGFFVIRFDNRDAGRSTQIDAPVPPIMRAMAGFSIDSPYLLGDMADDAFGLLDHLGIERAHVMGASMGGMIAQTMAIARPERLLSLTSIMSTTGDRRAGMPKLRVWSVLMRRAPSRRDAYVEHFVRVFRMIGSPGFEQDEARTRELAAVTFERGHHPAGTARQLAAILASGDRTPRLRELSLPAVVIHGTDDPLVPFRGGAATARAIPGADLIAVPGMGHDLPRDVWPKVFEALKANAQRAAARQPA